MLDQASALDAKDRIGYLPEERGVYKKMKVGAYLAYIARLKGAPKGNLKKNSSSNSARVNSLLTCRSTIELTQRPPD